MNSIFGLVFFVIVRCQGTCLGTWTDWRWERSSTMNLVGLSHPSFTFHPYFLKRFTSILFFIQYIFIHLFIHNIFVHIFRRIQRDQWTNQDLVHYQKPQSCGWKISKITQAFRAWNTKVSYTNTSCKDDIVLNRWERLLRGIEWPMTTVTVTHIKWNDRNKNKSIIPHYLQYRQLK
jgi:hypothetical protein